MSKYELQTYCSDCGKRKRYVNKSKEVYYCFVCGSGGKIRGSKTLAHQTLERSDTSKESQELPPKNWELTDYDRNYMGRRGISERVLESYSKFIRSTETGILFFFPTEDYWQERRWSAFRPPPWRFPKNSRRTTKDGVGYFCQLGANSERIVLVEGVFDALKVATAGASSFAALSKKVHDAQAALLARHYESCVLLLDSDASVADINTGLLTLSNHMDVEVIRLAEGDPADQTVEYLQELLDE